VLPTIYLDYNATWPLCREAREAMVAWLTDDSFGNPSSVHAVGRRARAALGRARRQVAAWIGAPSSDELVFTSGGTEADNWALWAAVHAGRRAGDAARGGHVISSPLEHPAVLEPLGRLRDEGVEVTLLPVDGCGRIDPQELRSALRPDTLVVSLAGANHELGNRYPIAEYAALCNERGVLFHTDCVQLAGKGALDVAALGADLVTFSAHKIGGPKGVGAVWLRRPELGAVAPVIVGGHQERGRRGGTENLLGIVGFGAAAEVAGACSAQWQHQLRELRDRLEQGLVDLGGQLNGALAERLCNTVNVSFPGVAGDLLMTALDLEGVCVSTGAACTSGSVRVSAVVQALGVAPERAAGATRFSLGPETSGEEIERVLQVVGPLVVRLRAAGG
jgi:cysteine desulfurase